MRAWTYIFGSGGQRPLERELLKALAYCFVVLSATFSRRTYLLLHDFYGLKGANLIKLLHLQFTS